MSSEMSEVVDGWKTEDGASWKSLPKSEEALLIEVAYLKCLLAISRDRVWFESDESEVFFQGINLVSIFETKLFIMYSTMMYARRT